MKNHNHVFSEEEINNIRELGQVLMEIRARLIREGIDIEKLRKELKENRKKI